MTRPLYIFDLDGTLADLKHRRHFVEKPKCTECALQCWPTGRKPGPCQNCAGKIKAMKWSPNWDAFHAACVNDKPIPQIIGVLRSLRMVHANIWIWSGRADSVRQESRDWLLGHGVNYDTLQMRPVGDYTPDDTLKESWLKAMSREDRARLVMTFDDRDRVVAMWRRNGIVCAQVAPGDF